MQTPGILNVIGGADRGKRYDLTRTETRIGRGTDQDFVLSDIAVSRRHVVIHQEGDRYRLQDLGSGNGSLVNGQKISSHFLSDGDVIEIGQTVMRFDHPVQRQAPAAQQRTLSAPGVAPSGMTPSPQAAFAPPTASVASAMPPIGGADAPGGMPFGSGTASVMSPGVRGGGNYTPSSATFAPGEHSLGSPMGGGYSALQSPSPSGMSSGARGGLLAVLGLVSVGGIGVILMKTAFAKPVQVPSEAAELYRRGLAEFAKGEFETAKGTFTEARAGAADSTDVQRYLTACDQEIEGKAHLKSAEKAISARRFSEAMKSLVKIEEGSVTDEAAAKLRREVGPKASRQELAEAQRLAASDGSAAREHAELAVKFDARNEDARALVAKLSGGGAVAAAAPVKEPTEAVAKAAPPAPSAKAVAPIDKGPKALVASKGNEPKLVPIALPSSGGKSGKGGKGAVNDDSDLAPVRIPVDSSGGGKPVPIVVNSGGGGSGGGLGGNSLNLYKNKDLSGAEKALRSEASSTPARASELNGMANQVKTVKAALDRADAESGSKPDAAVKDYQDALDIDQKISKGALSGYIKPKLGKAQLALAQQVFSQGKYELAFSNVQQAQKLGAGDGGLPKQLESKAMELLGKGQSMQKSNPAGAKQLYRQVTHMVPQGSPAFNKASSLLSSGGSRPDEDED